VYGPFTNEELVGEALAKTAALPIQPTTACCALCPTRRRR
jgi:hypothetical protein